MRSRRFGATDLQVSEIGLGCARIGGIFQGGPQGYLDLIACAVDRGITLFDTADMYSQGESEKLLGKALRNRRQQVVIATKAGYQLPAQRKWIAAIKPIARPIIQALGLKREKLAQSVRGAPSQDFSPAYLRSALEGSLRRLRTDYVDLFQLHSPPRSAIETGEWLAAAGALRKEGKIRHFGIACDHAADAQLALAQPGVEGVQVTVNLLQDEAASLVLPLAQQKNAGVIAREILANGLLIKEGADPAAYAQNPAQAEERRGQLARVREQSRQRGVPMAKLAIDYVLALPGVSSALVGARSREQLEGTLRFL